MEESAPLPLSRTVFPVADAADSNLILRWTQEGVLSIFASLLRRASRVTTCTHSECTRKSVEIASS